MQCRCPSPWRTRENATTNTTSTLDKHALTESLLDPLANKETSSSSVPEPLETESNLTETAYAKPSPMKKLMQLATVSSRDLPRSEDCEDFVGQVLHELTLLDEQLVEQALQSEEDLLALQDHLLHIWAIAPGDAT